MSEKLKQLFVVIIFNFLLVVIVFSFHSFFPSILNNLKQNPNLPWHHIDNNYLSIWWGFHRGHPVFAARPVTTFVTGVVHQILPIGLGTSFVFVSFGCLFLCGVLIYFLAQAYVGSRDKDAMNRVSTIDITDAHDDGRDPNHRFSVVSSILFFTTFSILFAFFRPISSFDEPIQYVAILLVLVSMYFKKYGWGIVALSVAVLTRETTALLYPGLFLLVFGTLSPVRVWREIKGSIRLVIPTEAAAERRNPSDAGTVTPALRDSSTGFSRCGSLTTLGMTTKNQTRKELFLKITLFIIPLIVYSIVIPLVLKSSGQFGKAGAYLVSDRWQQWHYNVHNFQYGFEAIISMIAVLGLPVACLILYRKFFSYSAVQKTMVKAGAVSMIINTPVVFIGAFAQEARLFALPLLFLWPVLGEIVVKLVRLAVQNFKKQLVLKLLVLFTSVPLWYVVAFKLYQPTFSGGSGILYQMYVFVELIVMILFIVGTCSTKN